MFGKRFLYVVIYLTFLLCSCAQPKYETPSSSQIGNVGQSSQEQKASDCQIRFKTSGYCLALHWEVAPTSNKAGSLIFKVYRGNAYDDSPVGMDFSNVPSLVLWMPSMGHGSIPTTTSLLDIGTFRASNVFFIMPGEWEMRFQVKDGVNLLDEAVVNITL